MLSIVHLTPSAPGEDLRAPGEATLAVLAARDGFVRGSLGRATDDPDAWVLSTEWVSVGAYRRALGHYDTKMTATTFFYLAAEAPSAFEQLVTAGPGGLETVASETAESLAGRLAADGRA